MKQIKKYRIVATCKGYNKEFRYGFIEEDDDDWLKIAKQIFNRELFGFNSKEIKLELREKYKN